MTTIWEGCGWCPHLSGITTITSPSHPAGQIRKSEPVPGKGRVQLQSHSARAPQTELGRIELIFILQDLLLVLHLFAHSLFEVTMNAVF